MPTKNAIPSNPNHLLMDNLQPQHAVHDPLTTNTDTLQFLQDHSNGGTLRRRQIEYFKQARPELRPAEMINSDDA